MSAGLFIVAALACGLGAVVRFQLSRLNGVWKLPWPIFTANVLGSVALGAIAHIALTAAHPDALMLVAGAGFAGGLTTFSSFAVDGVVLWRERRPAQALGYLGATFVAGLAGAALGWAIASAL